MKILVAYDGSKLCKDALTLGKQHAVANKGEVIAITSLYVHDSFEIKEAENAMVEAKQIFDDGAVPFTTEISVAGMNAGEDIVRFAGEQKVDEIIVGVKKRSKVGKVLFGSTLQYVVLNAPCPVVTIK
jgi:nucleotide-binding universal stress UspA family protein